MSDEDQRDYLKKVQEYWKDDRDRLVRWNVIQTMFLICILVGLAAWGSYQLRLLRSQVNGLYANAQQVKVTELSPEQFVQLKESLVPRDGRDGEKGDKGETVVGPKGSSGADGVSIQGPPGLSVTPDMVASAVAAIIEANPDRFKGANGEQGPAGRTYFVQQNLLTGLWECRGATDVTWQPIAECSQ